MSTLRVGTEIGSYVIVANPDPASDGSPVLGQGAFGITYCGKQRGRLGRAVAIKEYFPNLLAHRNRDGTITTTKRSKRDFELGLKEFLEEAEALNRFRHPNIAAVLDFVEAKGSAYIIMEWIAGKTIAQHVGSARRGDLRPMSTEELQPILIPLLGALDTLHGSEPQMLHRDIKPSNIVVREADRAPVLIDFGSARQVTAAATQRLTTILTDGYAPYEQYALTDEELEEEYGDLAEANTDSFPRQGPATDIYGLGAVCHFALTGKRPPNALKRKFGSVTYQPLTSRVEGDPLFLGLVDRALALEPQDRFASAREWRDALESRAAPPPPAPPDPPAWVPLPPDSNEADAAGSAGWIVAGFAVVALVAILILASLTGRDRPGNNVAAPATYADSADTNDLGMGNIGDVNVATDNDAFNGVGAAENAAIEVLDNAAMEVENSVGNVATPPPLRELRFSSVCSRPISVILRWFDSSGRWLISVWHFNGNESIYFAYQNTKIRTSLPQVYIWAWIPDGNERPSYTWHRRTGDPGATFTYNNYSYPMRAIDLQPGGSGEYVLGMNCDGYRPPGGM